MSGQSRPAQPDHEPTGNDVRLECHFVAFTESARAQRAAELLVDPDLAYIGRTKGGWIFLIDGERP
jgi:hypothetical protein